MSRDLAEYLTAFAWSCAALIASHFVTSDTFVHGQIAGLVFAMLWFSRHPVWERR